MYLWKSFWLPFKHQSRSRVWNVKMRQLGFGCYILWHSPSSAMSFNERILCIMLFGNEKNIGKSFLRGWMFHWYWDFSSLLIFRIKFPLLLFFSPSSPSLNSTKQWEKLSKNFVSFCTSSYALCFKVCDKSISSVFSFRENDEERNFSSRI